MKSELSKIFAIAIVITVALFITGCGKREVWNGNILIITLDTTRSDHIPSYGYDKGSTPNIDHMANEGVRFENCYSSTPLTLPSHSSIFTGKYSIGHGVRNNGTYVLSEKEKTMAEYLSENGYNTYAVIAAFVLQSKFGVDQGFKVYDDTIDSEDLHKTLKSEIDAKAVYNKFDNWIGKNSGSKFFAWVHFYDPHTPYILHDKDLLKKKERDQIEFYDGEITYTDGYIGKILNRLEEENVADDTLIIIIGDHGEAFGEHEEFASHMIFCYEANLRVPLIFYNKKLFNEPRVINDRVDTIDILPTILDMTGIDKGEDIQGKSLENLIKGDKSDGDRTIYFESMYGKEEFNWAPLTGIIEGDYKYISLPRPELYNIKKDPLEKDNLFRKKGSLLREMDEKLKRIILKYSGKGYSKRELEKEDLEHLKSLGYISSFNRKGGEAIDPKIGITLNVKLTKISSQIDTGDLNKLEKELLEIKKTKLGKGNFLTYMYLYRIYMKKKELKNVMEVLSEAIRILPHATPFRINYISHLSDLGRYEEVITSCNDLLSIEPLYTRAYIILGETYEILGEKKKSSENFLKALELEPENISLQIKFSEKLLSEHKFQEVLKIYDTLLEFDDIRKNKDFLFKVALFNTKYGSIERSGEILAELVRKEPSGKYYYYYSLILSRLGDRVNALRNMQIAFSQYYNDLTTEQITTARMTIEALK